MPYSFLKNSANQTFKSSFIQAFTKAHDMSVNQYGH
jgi:hypothetical protein